MSVKLLYILPAGTYALTAIPHTGLTAYCLLISARQRELDRHSSNLPLASASLPQPDARTRPATVGGYPELTRRHTHCIESLVRSPEGYVWLVPVYKMQPSTRHRIRQPGIDIAQHWQPSTYAPTRPSPGYDLRMGLSSLTRLLYPCSSNHHTHPSPAYTRRLW